MYGLILHGNKTHVLLSCNLLSFWGIRRYKTNHTTTGHTNQLGLHISSSHKMYHVTTGHMNNV